MDEIDRAAAREAEFLSDVLRDQRRRQARAECVPAAEFCEDCEEPIPQARRELVAGVQTCADCQTMRERANLMRGGK